MNTLLIDSNYLCHRARFAIHQELSHEGLNTRVIFGFLSEILKLRKQFETREFLFFWDSRRNVRREFFPGYKQRLPKSPEEQAEFERDMLQFNLLKNEILPQIGFRNIFRQTGYESDDLMAKLVLENTMYSWIIVTGDEDLYQLLGYCRIWHPAKGKMMSSQDLKTEYGINPIQWQDVKMIGGCTSDTVPGIPGVAEKTAIKFLRGELGKETKAYLMITSPEGKEIQDRNRMLVCLPYPGTKPVKIAEDKFDINAFRDICRKYGLKSFLYGDKLVEWNSLLGGSQ